MSILRARQTDTLGASDAASERVLTERGRARGIVVTDYLGDLGSNGRFIPVASGTTLGAEPSLEGGFTTRTIQSTITGESHEAITLPTLALAARRDGDLDWVVPSCEEGERITTVRDQLATIARHGLVSHAPL